MTLFFILIVERNIVSCREEFIRLLIGSNRNSAARGNAINREVIARKEVPEILKESPCINITPSKFKLDEFYLLKKFTKTLQDRKFVTLNINFYIVNNGEGR